MLYSWRGAPWTSDSLVLDFGAEGRRFTDHPAVNGYLTLVGEGEMRELGPAFHSPRHDGALAPHYSYAHKTMGHFYFNIQLLTCNLCFLLIILLLTTKKTVRPCPLCDSYQSGRMVISKLDHLFLLFVICSFDFILVNN